MSEHTDEEIQKAKDILSKDNPTDEEIEQVDTFFGKQVRISDKTLQTIKDKLQTYDSEVSENAKLEPQSDEFDVENGTVLLKVKESEPTVVYLVVYDENENNGFELIEDDIEKILLFELESEPPFRTHTESELRQYKIDFAVDFSEE